MSKPPTSPNSLTGEVKIFVKSRRIGGSWAEAGESALEASRTNGQDTWYIGYTKDMAIEFIRDVADWAKFYNLAVDEIQEYEEVFENGDEKKAILAFTIKLTVCRSNVQDVRQSTIIKPTYTKIP